MPRVSIILPNYNYARYLKERVRSILHQSLEDWELIYLDDASTDASNAVMEQFAGDPRVKMHLFSENSGQVYRRWNDGAALATGDLLWFAGADDTASPRFLEKMVTYFDDPAVTLAHSAPLFIDSLGRVLSLGNPFLRPGREADYLAASHVAAAADELPRLIEGNYIHTASTSLIRRAAFEAAGGFDARVRLCADWLLYLNLVCAGGSVAYCHEQLATYRAHANTVTATTKDQRILLEWAFCLSHVYEKSGRFVETTGLKKQLRQKIHLFLFEATADNLPVPPDLQFAVDYVKSVAV